MSLASFDAGRLAMHRRRKLVNVMALTLSLCSKPCAWASAAWRCRCSPR
jgi:phosphate transport system permease protein